MEPQSKKCKLDYVEQNSSTKIISKPDKFNYGPFPEVFIRFSHLAEQIFNCLDSKSLAKCNLVSRSWQNFLEYHKILNVRIILSVVEKYHTVQESWKKVLKSSKTQVIIDLRESVGKVYDQVRLLYDAQPAFFSKKIDTYFSTVYGYTGIRKWN